MKSLLLLCTVLILRASVAVAQDSLRQSINDIIKQTPGSHPPKSIRGIPNDGYAITYRLDKLFTLADAEQILGEQTHRTDSSVTSNDSATRYHLTFMANDTDAISGNLGAIYYMGEQYRRIGVAKEKYLSIKNANADHTGVETLPGVGDEAYFHSDGTNFLFIIARKGQFVLTMKLNKTTSKSSRTEFERVAREIVKKM